MGKIAFLFPGQGAQYPGMGQSLYESSPEAEAVFRLADSLRPGTTALCFSGSEEALAETQNTQPCLFVCELAAAKALEAAGIRPDMLAGFSLGEVAALTYAGAVSEAEGFRLVCERARLMQADAEKQDTAMAAVVKLSPEVVEALCARFPAVYPVNYNCPGQITISCARESLAPFTAAVKEAGGRALPLKVRGGFHSVFMAEAAAQFAKILADVEIGDPRLPLYSNFTALPYAGDYRRLLSEQIQNPVRFEALVRHMPAEGVDCFFEVGPGNVLAGLIKKIEPSAKVYCVGDAEGLQKAVEEHRTW